MTLCGIVVLLCLAITSVFVIAIPCDGTIPSEEMSENSACFDPSWAKCSASASSTPNCPGSAPYHTQLSMDEHYFGFADNPKTGEVWATRADSTGTVLCATEYSCHAIFSNGSYRCIVGNQVYGADGQTI